MSHASSIVSVVRRLFRRHPLEMSVLSGALALVLSVAVPVHAQEQGRVSERAKAQAIQLQIAAMQNTLVPFGRLPDPPEPDYSRTIRVSVSAYSSDPWQTDDTPFITASGSHVRDGIIAANFLPFGTKVRFPHIFGDKVFVVEDRMNKRYPYKMDVWMEHTSEARKFGVKYAEVQILK